MYWQYTPYGLPLAVAVTISVTIALFAWRRRPATGATTFALMMLAVAWWSACYALGLASTTVSYRLFWTAIRYLGEAFVSMLWLVFAIEYTGNTKWLTRRNLSLLAVAPIAIILLIFTNPSHNLLTRNAELVRHGSWVMMNYTRGPLYWISPAYNYIYLFAGTSLLLGILIRSPRIYQRQIKTLLVSVLVPWGTNIYIFTNQPFSSDLDFTSIAFTITGLVLAWGLFRYRLLDIVPAAHSAVVESMTDAVIALDIQDRIVDCNRAAERVLGHKAEKVIGRSIADVVAYPDLIERFRDELEVSTELTFGERDAVCHYDLRISPLHQRERLTGRLVVLRDITARKRAEQERERLIEELGAFARTVAHDLKNPLAVIHLYLDLLGKKGDGLSEEKRTKYLSIADRTAARMKSIIESLLLLAEVRNIENVEIQALDMAHIVRETLKDLDCLIERYHAEVIVSDCSTWPVVRGYAPWVSNVWANYLSNALKYGGRSPRIELGAAMQPDGMVRFWVRDNGPGIAIEDQKKLFLPFVQLGTASRQGSGLGLSIVHRIVTKLGGRAWLESDAGKGCTFFFTLPAYLRDDSAKS